MVMELPIMKMLALLYLESKFSRVAPIVMAMELKIKAMLVQTPRKEQLLIQRVALQIKMVMDLQRVRKKNLGQILIIPIRMVMVFRIPKMHVLILPRDVRLM